MNPVEQFATWFAEICAMDANPAGLYKVKAEMWEAFLEGWQLREDANKPQIPWAEVKAGLGL